MRAFDHALLGQPIKFKLAFQIFKLTAVQYSCIMDSSCTTSSSPEREGLESRGSSVSTTLREEYEDLLKYAVVAPNFDGTVNRVPLAPPHTKQGVVNAQQAEGNTQSPSSATWYDNNACVIVSQTQDVPNEQREMDDDEESISSMSSTPQVDDETIVNRPPPAPTRQPLPTMTAFSRTAAQTSPLSYQPTQHLDMEMTRLESHLDSWCLDLKRNVMVSLTSNSISFSQ